MGRGGAVCCDGRSPIYSGPPYAYMKNLWSPLRLCGKNLVLLPVKEHPPTNNGGGRYWSKAWVCNEWPKVEEINLIIYKHGIRHEPWQRERLRRRCENLSSVIFKSELCQRRKNFEKKILIKVWSPPLEHWKKMVPPLITPKNFGPPTNRPYLPVKNDSSLTFLGACAWTEYFRAWPPQIGGSYEGLLSNWN